MSDKYCPFCGEESISPIVFNCTTRKIDITPYYHRGMMCYERQIDALKSTLADKEERLTIWRTSTEGLDLEWLLGRNTFNKLCELGEI